MMTPESLSQAEELIGHWVTDTFGGDVVSLRRQPRWRPMWFATVVRSGETLELVVRGDRTDMPPIFPLDHEMSFQQLLHAHGIPVPAVQGWIEGLPAYVMDRVDGVGDFVDNNDRERASVVDDYLSILVKLHELPIAPFTDAGIRRAERPSGSSTLGLDRYEEHYRSLKRHADPLLEFFLGWLRRNPVDSRGREAPIVWDSGQFHHSKSRVVALLDLELGHIGDPMMDLAAWRMRDTVIGYGDMNKLYSRYEELSGRPVDIDAIRWHHVAFTLSNQLAFSAALKNPTPASDLMTNLQWCCETNLFATEALAQELGLELPTVAMPQPRYSAARPAHEHMVGALRRVSIDDVFIRHELRTLFRLARHLQRRDEIGDELAEADLDDLSELLGTRPANWEQGEERLERFVLDDAGRSDAKLLRLFHKRNLRAQMLLGPAGSAMTHHHSIQPF